MFCVFAGDNPALELSLETFDQFGFVSKGSTNPGLDEPLNPGSMNP